MKSRKSNLPTLYYFNKLEEVNVAQLKSNAIILIGHKSSTIHEPAYRCITGIIPDRQYTKHTTNAYFVKQNQFLIDGGSPKVVDFELGELHWASLMEKLQANGEVVLEDGESRGTERLCDIIQRLSLRERFPYTDTTLYMSRDGRSIRITSISGMFNDLSAITASDQNNLHPILRDYIQNNNNPSYNLLTLLYKIKASPDFQISSSLYQVGGIPIGFGMEKGAAHEVSIKEMITAAHKAMGTTYMSFTAFSQGTSQLISRFRKSELTPLKENILTDFHEFYRRNKKNPDLMPRSVLVETWIHDYMRNHNGLNPFTILSKHRRTGLLSIFNPTITDSTNLFNKFLAGEIIPATLRQLMQEQPHVDNKLQI